MVKILKSSSNPPVQPAVWESVYLESKGALDSNLEAKEDVRPKRVQTWHDPMSDQAGYDPCLLRCIKWHWRFSVCAAW